MMLNPCNADFVAQLAASLPPGTLRSPEPRDLGEPRGLWHGQAGAVAAPRSTAEVATVLRACAGARVGVVARGGGTGLVGGAVMEGGPVPLVLSLSRMRAVRSLWPGENVIAVEAGATLASVHEAAAAAGRLFPLSLASEGSATIGGNLATNAGGTAVLRYGNARELCLGLEAVMADGSVIHGLRRLRKDNAGYDLRGLLIGSEGTLAIITAATLRLFPLPSSRAVALVAVPSPHAAQDLLRLAEGRLSGLVSGFELIGRMAFDFLVETGTGPHSPLGQVPDWAVLIELGLPAAMDPAETMAALHQEAVARGLAGEGVVAASEAQAATFWALREAIPEANRRIGAIASHDISLPLGEIAGFIDEAGARLAALGDFRINAFGHLGDGNLHYNVFGPRGDHAAPGADLRARVRALVHGLVVARGGSFAAEHGIGRLKLHDLERFGDGAALAAMRAVKAALDPSGILNPGAVLAPGVPLAPRPAQS